MDLIHEIKFEKDNKSFYLGRNGMNKMSGIELIFGTTAQDQKVVFLSPINGRGDSSSSSFFHLTVRSEDIQNLIDKLEKAKQWIDSKQ